MDMKCCCTCKQNKPFSEFHRNRSRSDGYQPQCKDCRRAYRSTEVGGASQRKYSQGANGRQTRRRFDQKQKREHPERIKAISFLNNAVRGGTIHKPQECVICGKKGRVEGHHHKGYAEDHYLDVLWVCVKCHRQLHREKA